MEFYPFKKYKMIKYHIKIMTKYKNTIKHMFFESLK
jgi:hypothetical protein